MCIYGGNACEWVEGKSLGFCGTSLDVENFLKGKICLSIEWKYYTHVLMIYPQPVRRHYHPKYTLIRSLVVKAVHRHRTGMGSIPAGGPIVDEFFSTVPD